MHRVLNEDAATPPAAKLAAQQARLDAWRLDYKTVRPHESAGTMLPRQPLYPVAARLSRSGAAWEYPADHQAKRVSGNGYIKWRGRQVYLTEALAGQSVALVQRDEGDWAVRFRQFNLAILSDGINQIRPSRLGRTGVLAERVMSPEPIQGDALKDASRRARARWPRAILDRINLVRRIVCQAGTRKRRINRTRKRQDGGSHVLPMCPV